jgi:Domain of unknown function (DUF4252)
MQNSFNHALSTVRTFIHSKKSLYMKKFLFTAIAVCIYTLSAMAQDDAISRYFTKYAEDERFTVVYISPKMFDLIAKIGTNDPDWEKAKEVLKDIKGLRILAADNETEEGEPALVGNMRINGANLYKEAMQTLNGKSYDELMTVRDGQQNVRIMTKEANGIISELLLLVGEPEQFAMLSFVGNINLDKIATLGKTLDIEGAQHLNKISTKQ